MYLWFQGVLGCIACEAIVQLWFNAAPIQPVRKVLIHLTPWLTGSDTHLFNCKYCTSVWVAFFLILLFYCAPVVFTALTLFLSVHRISNFLHLLFSYLRDKQIDLRINRGKS